MRPCHLQRFHIDVQRVVPPILQVAIDHPVMLIAIHPRNEQRRAAVGHLQHGGGLLRQQGRQHVETHPAVVNAVARGVQRGQRLGQIFVQNTGEIGRIEVVLAVQHRTSVDVAQPTNAIGLGAGGQRQAAGQRRVERDDRAVDRFGMRGAPLLLRHGVKMAALQRIVDQTWRRDEPAATHLAVDDALRLQLAERLLQGNAGGGELLAQGAFGGQLAAHGELAGGDAGVQRLADGGDGRRCFTHTAGVPFQCVWPLR
uniref:GntR family transcriptional regulator n=1 Tax=Serratia marcescens TaxID=615 RepID=V5YWB4_SERMA|nr:GntR family transcriptional regulator [Serratia marcescens]